MDAAQRQALKAEMDAALKEREKLDVVIAYLSDRLGLTDRTEPKSANLAAAAGAKSRTPADEISKGQFSGKSATKAARHVLSLFGSDRPLKTQELFDALAKGGVRVKNANVLHRSLNRDDTFLRVERGLWSLSEWHPAIAQPPVRNDQGATQEEAAHHSPATFADEGEAADAG